MHHDSPKSNSSLLSPNGSPSLPRNSSESPTSRQDLTEYLQAGLRGSRAQAAGTAAAGRAEEAPGAAGGRLERVERLLRDAFAGHVEELRATRAEVEELRARLADAEARGLLAGAAPGGAWEGGQAAFELGQLSLRERLADLEHMAAVSAEENGAALAAAHAMLLEMHGRLLACERQPEDLRHAHAGLAREMDRRVVELQGIQTRLDQVLDRVVACEQLAASSDDIRRVQALSSSFEVYAKEFDAMKVTHAKHAKEVEIIRASSVSHAATTERVSSMERISLDLKESVGRLTEELAATRIRLEGQEASLGDLKRSFTGLVNAEAKLKLDCSSLRERVGHFERTLDDAVRTQTAELGEVRTSYMRLDRDVLSRHGKLADTLTHEVQLREASHSTLQGRLDHLQGLLSDQADRHEKATAALDAVKAGQAKLANEIKAQDVRHTAVADRLDQLSVDKSEAVEHRTSLDQRVAFLEKTVANSLKERVGYIENLMVDDPRRRPEGVKAA